MLFHMHNKELFHLGIIWKLNLYDKQLKYDF